MPAFKQVTLKELCDQMVRYTPTNKKLEQLANAEKLLTEIETSRHYPYQYICFRLTEYRPESYPELLISGEALEHDLSLLIEALVRTSPAQRIEEVREPVVTLEQISKQLNVSTKTITRWRNLGLVGRKIVHKGRCQLGFMQSIVERFLSSHQDRVTRSSRFSQLSEEEKAEIVNRAEVLVREIGSQLTEVSRQIAQEMGRSPETIRYTLRAHDRDCPDAAFFPSVTPTLDPEARLNIYNSYRRGFSVEALAKKYKRTRNSMYRVLNEVRAERLLAQPLDYIHSPEFDDPANEELILAEMPRLPEWEEKKRALKTPKDVQPELLSLYEMPLLDKDQERHLFRKMNFLKHQASLLRKKMSKTDEPGAIEASKVRLPDLKKIEELQSQACAIKELLISCNMRLVVSISKKYSAQSDNFFELLSDGNMSLIKAVEKFDYFRGNKFSTYGTWSIIKNYSRSIPEEKLRKERFVTGNEELFEMQPDKHVDESEVMQAAEQATSRVNRLLDYLEPREREIIRMRAGLDDAPKGMTLEEIGQHLGITKERVRQINVRIMQKLRTLAKEQKLDS